MFRVPTASPLGLEAGMAGVSDPVELYHRRFASKRVFSGLE